MMTPAGWRYCLGVMAIVMRVLHVLRVLSCCPPPCTPLLLCHWCRQGAIGSKMLWDAARNDDLAKVKELLSRGADPNWKHPNVSHGDSTCAAVAACYVN